MHTISRRLQSSKALALKRVQAYEEMAAIVSVGRKGKQSFHLYQLFQMSYFQEGGHLGHSQKKDLHYELKLLYLIKCVCKRDLRFSFDNYQCTAEHNLSDIRANIVVNVVHNIAGKVNTRTCQQLQLSWMKSSNYILK